ncbi:MAG: dihydrofolate reductase family protein [Actinomycetota bacterium]|nr:dihydrofolate reductase family protein [Actinomycetota bacterium]
MRRIVVTEFVSLDGVMEDPGGGEDFDRGGWSFKFPDPEGMKYKLDEVMTHDALLLGRMTYQGFAAAWPSVTDESGFADKMNSMPKFVVSTTLDELEWNNSTLIKENVVEEVSKLKEQPGQDILVGGSRTLVQTLMAHDLVDEYRLMVFPIVLGAGKRLFGDTSDASVLRLVDSKTLDSGALILTYEPARDGAEGPNSG